MKTNQLTLNAVRCRSCRRAIELAKETGRRAVLVAGCPVVMDEADAVRLDEARVRFAYLGIHNERLCTVPTNGNRRALVGGTFRCQECGRRFRTTRAAERASLNGCPNCGGVDVDLA